MQQHLKNIEYNKNNKKKVAFYIFRSDSEEDWIYETQIDLKCEIEIGTFSKDGRKLKELAFRRFFERQLIIA